MVEDQKNLHRPDGGDSADRRVVVYAFTRAGDAVPPHVKIALEALRPHATRLAVVVGSDVGERARDEVASLADDLIEMPSPQFDLDFYARGIGRLERALATADELLLTGEGWFGPLGDFGEVFAKMAAVRADVWQMVENRAGSPRDFSAQGFPAPVLPWSWTVIRRSALASSAWREYWEEPGHADGAGESVFAARFSAQKFSVAYAYSAKDFGYADPALYSANRLIDAGCPIVSTLPFSLYPPFLQQHAIVGREIAASIARAGYPLDAVWSHLARTVQPKALNTNAAMLEIIPPRPVGAAVSQRIAVVAYISDTALADELLGYVENVPAGFDLFVTTTDGVKASALRAALRDRASLGARSVDIRVTPTGGGGDMGDFFVGCRDVIASDEYDLVVKVHVRRKRAKTLNVRRYFRRYQWENVLGSEMHVRNVIALFEREPGLGLVFPPMLHIGYSTMGHGWGPYRPETVALAKKLGVRVPLENISPLAPYGATWIARPAALRRMASLPWTYTDYKRSRSLSRVQERLLVAAAAEDGFHVRTVLTPEHAAISHTAIEFKADQLTATSVGYPVDQIEFMHRAGWTGQGGLVGLSRMYLRANHPRISAVVMPLSFLAERGFLRARDARGRFSSRRAHRLSRRRSRA